MQKVNELLFEIESYFESIKNTREMYGIYRQHPVFMLSVNTNIQRVENGDITRKPYVDLALSKNSKLRGVNVWSSLNNTPEKIKEWLAQSESLGLTKSQIFEVVISYSV